MTDESRKIHMKTLGNIFLHSIKLPKRNAAFALNRIGMDKVIFYIFLLLGIASFPGLIEQIQTNANAQSLQIQSFFFLIFFFIFYYLIMTVAVLLGISLIAYLGSWIAALTKRKLRYSILWKMAACITTIPILVFTVMSFFIEVSIIFLSIAITFHIIVFIQTIFLYPKRRHLSKKQ